MKSSGSFLIFIFLSSVTLSAGLLSCSKFNDNNVQLVNRSANEVWIASNTFEPSTLIVPVNTIVKWTNWDSYIHTVTSDSAMFDSDFVPAKGTFSYSFTTKGIYKYHCNKHPGMSGTIVVQ